jgi:hypothetical protein
LYTVDEFYRGITPTDSTNPSIFDLSIFDLSIFDLAVPSIWMYLAVEAIMEATTNGIWNYLGALIFLAALVGILWWILRVCAADARRRGKSPLLVTLLVFVSFPLGLLLWLLFRPEPLNSGDKSFRLEDHRVQ